MQWWLITPLNKALFISGEWHWEGTLERFIKFRVLKPIPDSPIVWPHYFCWTSSNSHDMESIAWVLCFDFHGQLVTKQLSHQLSTYPQRIIFLEQPCDWRLWQHGIAPHFAALEDCFLPKFPWKLCLSFVHKASAAAILLRHRENIIYILLIPWYHFLSTSLTHPRTLQKSHLYNVWPKFKCKRRWSRSSGSQLVATSSSFSSFFGWGSATASSHFTESSLASFFLRAVRPDPEWFGQVDGKDKTHPAVDLDLSRNSEKKLKNSSFQSRKLKHNLSKSVQASSEEPKVLSNHTPPKKWR